MYYRFFVYLFWYAKFRKIRLEGIFHMKTWTYQLIIIILSILIIGCEENETSIEKVEEDEVEEASKSNIEEESETASISDEDVTQLAIGEAVKFEETTITLNEARLEPGGEFEKPKNDHFLVVNLTAKNNSPEQEFIVSSLLNVELVDADNNTYSATILTEGAGDQFDGGVDAGETMTGDIPFDVLQSDIYELHFTNPFQTGEATWIIESDDLIK